VRATGDRARGGCVTFPLAGRGLLGGQAGWTLMETLVVCGMITVLAGIAVPQYQAMAMHMRTGAAASRVLNDLAYARAMAQRTGVPHYVNVTDSGTLRYQVQRSMAPPAINPGGDLPAIRTIDLGSDMPGVAFSLSGAALDPYGNSVVAPVPGGPVVFNPRGLPNTGAAYFVSSTDGDVSYAITVNGSGRVRMWRRRDGGWQ
jgi:Tfp pilus assembly protein FimT